MKKELKTCVECDNHLFYNGVHACVRIEGREIDLVTGLLITKYCGAERVGSTVGGYCGASGQFFTPAPPPAPEEVKEKLEETKRKKWLFMFFNLN